MRLLAAADRADEPWKNGHGRTSPVGGGEGWRVSIAELHDAFPFSGYPGASRLLMPLSPSGVLLSVNGQTRACESLRAYEFEGEDTVFAPEVTEPVEALNLIWQRQRYRGTLAAVSARGAIELAGDGLALLAIVCSGRLSGPAGTDLNRLDALSLAHGETATLSGRGDLALVGIEAAGRCSSGPV